MTIALTLSRTTTTPDATGQTTGAVRLLLQAEGGAVLAVSLWAFDATGGNWLAFAALFLLPDAFMLGYLRDPRIGAAFYNIGHSTMIPVALILAGLTLGTPTLTVGLIWTAHIGFDRLMGYGLKYPRSFHATHLMSRG